MGLPFLHDSILRFFKSASAKQLSWDMVFTAETEIKRIMEMPPLFVSWPNGQGIIPWAWGQLSFCFLCAKCQNASAWKRLSLLSAVGKKQPELLFTLWTASWVKIVLAAWSKFKPHCRKRSFLEEKIFLPTYRFAYGHFPRGEEERQSHAKVKPIPFSIPRPRKAHQNPR